MHDTDALAAKVHAYEHISMMEVCLSSLNCQAREQQPAEA